ncbi:MAG TPA: tetratricopeptide repeat protein [Blastocatellia bacterium]|nr:tetratricopeptide repeat protein [Blastocatellia bacterium]HMZ17535.1 tetratricopeptide repeat protein [Blastocatellia bacterium]
MNLLYQQEATRHGMATHFNRTEAERFYARTLNTTRMAAWGAHIAECAACLALYQEVFEQKRNYAPVVINLSPAIWLKDEHLDYESLVAYAEGSLNVDEREITEMHLQLCRPCCVDAAEFTAWYKESEAELRIRYTPASPERQVESTSRWNWLAIFTRKPTYAFALVLAAALLFSVIVLLKPDAKDRTPEQPFASPTPADSVAQTPVIAASPAVKDETPKPIESPANAKRNAESPEIILQDGAHRVSINASGELSGLTGISPTLREAVRNFLTSGSLKQPKVVAALVAENRTLRGTMQSSSIKLLAPAGVVIADDRPVFTWRPIPSATAWRVYVSDARARLVADSGALPAATTQWKLPASLKRGENYSWAVGAVVNGEEITAPSVTESEVRFRVLGDTEWRALQQLQQTTDSHLALGVFYAHNGLLDEAQREFQQLVNFNPDSPQARKLLRLIQSWR